MSLESSVKGSVVRCDGFKCPSKLKSKCARFILPINEKITYFFYEKAPYEEDIEMCSHMLVLPDKDLDEIKKMDKKRSSRAK